MIAYFDNAILDWFLSVQNEALTAVFRWITLLGEGGFLMIVLGIVLLFGKRTRTMGVTVLAGLVLSFLVSNLCVKPMVARPRPCWVRDTLMLIPVPKDYSFPSGHASSSFATAMAILMWNRKAGIGAMLGAVVMSATRMYFQVHYPTDILVGMCIGLLVGVCAYRIVKRAQESEKLQWGQRRKQMEEQEHDDEL